MRRLSPSPATARRLAAAAMAGDRRDAVLTGTRPSGPLSVPFHVALTERRHIDLSRVASAVCR